MESNARSHSSLDPTETTVDGDWIPTNDDSGFPILSALDTRIAEPTLCQTFRHSGWQATRKRVYTALARAGATGPRKLRFEACGSQAWIIRDAEDPDSIRISSNRCNDRFCTPCANERARRLCHAVINRCEDNPGRFVTLTVRGRCVSLAAQLDRLIQGFRKLRQSAFWKKRTHGGVAFLEINWNDVQKTWHPHFHCIVHGVYMCQRELADVWERCTGDSRIVDIRAIRNEKNVARYITKYASKPLNPTFSSNDDTLADAVKALRGRRLCITFGDWKALKLTDDEATHTWERVAELETVMISASRGDEEALDLLSRLRGEDLDVVLTETREKFPDRPDPPAIQPEVQRRLFELWA